MVRLRMPERFLEAHMGTLDPKVVPFIFEYVKKLTDNVTAGKGLLLSGPPGIGKTWALAALTTKYAFSCLRPDYEFLTAPDMIDLMSSYNPVVDEYRECPWSWTLGNVPWLVINDLGKEFLGGKVKAQVSASIGRILRARSEKVLVTHVTTNLSGKEINAVYGETVGSLLAEMTKTCLVTGKDRRLPR